ncbi:MAG TPA: polyketide synthase [Cyanobacteria bacterium UBA11370]|nr:polyketide synthase [Cyanobacteria bacterium UBA11370]HBY77707.1 polyketide synthase [Cyanobacteria bacterium UBA11148]
MNIESNGLEVAIIGISGRFPGSSTVDEFWENLKNGVEVISVFPDSQSNELEVKANGSKPSIKAGAVLDNVEQFDASFFGFNPREAEVMDPQHRLFLECAWEALENAGYDSERENRPIGVYAGVGMSTYSFYNLYPNRELMESRGFLQTLVGIDKDYVPTRVSYKLNLKGPSVSVGTACSSSLVAVHLACQSLLSGECDMALAAGVSVKVPQNELTLSPEEIVSPDGQCRAFDAKANGTIGGNGIGVVVLKRLEDALADGDYIYAVIKGSAINNDGALKVGYTAPSEEGQVRVIRAAQVMAEVEPKTISYMETHGTGTPLGDPIEIAAMTRTFRADTDKKSYCAIGSVKTNVGHLDAAAGIAGLIKTVLAIHHKLLPPSLNFETPNPEIDFENSPFYVNTKLAKWKMNGTPRRAGVSSFGFGGTNAHVILEEAPAKNTSSPSRNWQLLVLSAKTSSALETATANLANYVKQHPNLNLADIAYTLQLGRRAFQHRRIVVAKDIEDAVKALELGNPQRVFTQFEESSERPLVFMFTGQGAQYVNMARELYQNEPTFREECDRCFALLQPHLAINLRSCLYPTQEDVERASEQLKQTAITQPALFVIEYALAKLWISWGVQPQSMIGHSIGEYVAACLAGVFSLEDALTLVATRGQLMQQMPAGAMLSVNLSADNVQPFLGEKLSLAASNSSSLSVVSGSVEAVEQLERQLEAKAIVYRRLHTSHAFHSEMMNPIVHPFTEEVKKVKLNPPQIPFISNVTGTWITATQATNPNYWAQHLRQTVRFSEGISELLKDSRLLFLEVGPGRTLSSLTKQQASEQIVLSSLPHPKDEHSDVATVLNALGRLWLAGVQVDWSGFYAYEKRDRIPLPTYPFERQRYWIDPPQQINEHLKQKPTTPLLWSSLVEAARIQSRQGIEAFDAPSYLIKQQSLEQLCVAYINLTLRRLGAFANPEERYSEQALYEQLSIQPQYQPLLSRWLKILVKQGQLEQHGDTFINLSQLSKEAFQTLLEKAKAQFVTTPQWLEFIQSCGENISAALLGKKQHLEILFPNGSLDNLEQFFKDAPLFDYYSAILHKILQQAAHSLKKDVNLRILEVGAGTGVTTSLLLPVLSPEHTTYTFTDANSYSLERAKQKFDKYPFVEYRLLDIEKNPENQGYKPHSFDVVVARNVLHSTQNIREALHHTQSLLAPGGVLLLWELTAPESLVFELVFSPIARSFADEDPRQDYPFLSKSQWQQELQNQGFDKIETLPEHQASEEHIFIAHTASTKAQIPQAFTKLRLSPQPEITVKSLQLSSSKKPDLTDWFYVPIWKQSTLPQLLQQTDLATQKSRWLVFVDEWGLGEQIVKQFEQKHQEVLQVRVGERFAHISEGVYTINPQRSQDYDALLAELISRNQLPQIIAHLWSVTPNVPHTEIIGTTQSETEFFEKSQIQGFYSLLYLAQAIGNHNLTDSMQIGVVSNNLYEVTGSEVLIPEKATVLGAVRVIPLEYPQISCRSIDIVLPESESVQEQQLVNQLIAELSISSSNAVVAYRSKHRWVQTFEPVRLEAKSEQIPQLRHGGVYLITGGLGGIGLVMAEHLARTVQAKLILIGRSEFPNRNQWEQWLATHEQHNPISEKIHQLKALEALGAEVLVVSADVSNPVQMQAVVNQAYEQFGQIHGIIHAAGLAIPGKMQLRKPEIIESVLAPKVQGVLVLEAIFKVKPLDFFVLFSSISSISGGYAVDYVAASTFLDAYAHYRASKNDSLTVTINWDNWQQVGMALQATVPDELKQFYEESQKSSITPNEGIEVFNRILSYPLPQIIVSGRELQTAIKQHHSSKNLESNAATRSTQQAYPRPNLDKAYIAPRNQVEDTIATIWQNLLGIEKVGVHDDFFELGGHSLLATQFISRIRKTLQVELPLSSIFEAPTVAKISDYLEKHYLKNQEISTPASVGLDDREEGEI